MTKNKTWKILSIYPLSSESDETGYDIEGKSKPRVNNF